MWSPFFVISLRPPERVVKSVADNSLKKGRYTKYSNKIGLYSNSRGGFVKNDTEVVLNFPFKDAVLEGGMSKEDKGRDERFLHLEIDSKDIDTLEEQKVLTDFRLVDEHGETPLTAHNDVRFFDEDGNLEQNLLIKGNNLLALHTLKSRLKGRIKLIYIDPPYNTGSDGFRYNDSFNHSSWLTFMKNRLEIARDLLRDDGIIYVQCDDNEQAYLKVLMDEIFGNLCINVIAVPMSNLSGQKIEHAIQGRKFPKIKEYLLVYSKTSNYKLNIPRIDKEVWDREYNTIMPDFTEQDFQSVSDYIADDDIDAVNNILKNQELVSLSSYLKDNHIADDDEWKMANSFRIIATKPNTALRKKALDSSFHQQIIAIRNNRGDIKIIRSDFNRESKTARIEITIAYTYLSTFVGDIWEQVVTTGGVAQEGGVSLTNGKKPEALIQRIIKSATSEGDIVLDYHLGSGTTSAVAHKMNRRWIGVEQMDYIETLAKERLKKVVAGEQGGISKDVDWNGGGSFVYFELKKYNQEYVERIMEATSLSELEDLYVDMRNNAFLKFWFDRSHFEKDEDFRQLDLDGRKNALADVLDENQLYLNYADMNDTRHNVTADEKALTDKFYGTN
jgi:adenine-specific DNA-methyltransferase